MVQTTSKHVFISYSRRDSDVMQRTVKYLRGQGIEAWVDNESLVPGTPIWEHEIERSIIGAFAIVVILSPDAKRSEWVLREITLADEYQKRVFPVLATGDFKDSVPFRLVSRQFVDLRFSESSGLAVLTTALGTYLEELEKLEEERQTREREAEIKAREDRQAKAEADRLAMQKADADRIAKEKAELDRWVKEEAERLFAKKAEEDRLAKAKADAERKAKVEARRKAKEEAKRLAAQKAEQDQTAKTKLEQERKAREKADLVASQKVEAEKIAKDRLEAERIAEEKRRDDEKAESQRRERQEAKRKAAEKAEQERITREKAEAETKAQEKAQRLVAQKAEEERITREKVESERKAKEKAQHPATQKAKRESLAREKTKAQQQVAEKDTVEEGKPVKTPWVRPATLRTVVIALILCGLAGLNYLPGIFGRSPGNAAQATNTAKAQATQTAIVRLTSIAIAGSTSTAIAKSTSTAIARSTNTAIALATAQSRNKYIATLEARSELVFGPETGSLEHNADDTSVQDYSPGVTLKNFIVTAIFQNPYSIATGPWDYGLMFRNESGNNQYRLIIRSTGDWELQNWTGSSDTSKTIQMGKLSNLNTRENGSNTIWLYCLDNKGMLYVNEEFIGDLDLSARLNSGDVSIATGMYTGDEINGYSTDYEEYSIWEIP